MPVDLFNAPKPLSFVLKGSHDRYSSTNSILGNHRILVIFVALLVKASMIVIIHLFSNSDDHHRNVYNGLK